MLGKMRADATPLVVGQIRGVLSVVVHSAERRPPSRPPSTFQTVSRETVWKSEWGRAMTYAPGHGKELPNRSIRCRMGVSEAPCSGSHQARSTENPQHPRDPQRYLLRVEERLRLAAFAPRLPALGDRLLVV